jgi:hypothetical protein
MTDHKNWALTTASIFGLLALWALFRHRGAKVVGVGFVALILAASGLLAVTGYKGGEVVYRHGGGVMRMPEVSGDGGHGSHSHGEGESADHHGAAVPEPHGDHNDHNAAMESPAMKGNHEEHDHGAHAH